MAPRYKVTLTIDEREFLDALLHTGSTDAKKFVKARALLLCDAGEYGPAWKVSDVAQALGITSRTIEHLKQRFVEEGLESALQRKQQATSRCLKFDGAFEARLIALACSEPPTGYARWTLRLLADQVVELNLAPEISSMTVYRILKKMNLSLI